MTLTHATWNCAKVMLALTLPFQAVIPNQQRDTHHFCNRQAIEILRQDGFHREAKIAHSYLYAMDRGSVWCDRGFKNISHYYDSREGTGLWHGPDASTECLQYFNRALKKWQRGYYKEAFFYLGAACHLVQDLCVPYHARGQVLGGHKFFEDRARDQYENYSLYSGGIYHLSDCPGDWVRKNASFSSVFLSEVTDNNPLSVIDETIQTLLKRAQRTTAGFLQFSIHHMKA
ncbi:zinc dependent phospholipase C family protein [Desulforamulus ruminis]|uniref:zinc dependent phospholipase C family protein n=1 Tax=Desulforamulus ruminis TaxID=1564 RepID=UPI002FDA0154